MCFFLRGKLKLDEIIKQKGKHNCFISEITVLELRYGAENSENIRKSNKAVDLFVGGLTIIPISTCFKIYGVEKTRLRKIGRLMNDEFDFLIALTAIANKLILVTDNEKDFVNLPDLKIENWKIRA